MDSELIYMPAMRARQQEILVLNSFDFGSHIYPLVEIVKEFDRKRDSQTQRTFQDIYGSIIERISARRVFVDLPLHLVESGGMNDEVLKFSRGVISNIDLRTEYILRLSRSDQKIIPVISSFIFKTGEHNSITLQNDRLRTHFNSIAFRTVVPTFDFDWPEINALAGNDDYIIIDLDILPPYASSPVLKKIKKSLEEKTNSTKIILRSAINSDIQNISLEHGQVVYNADNSLIDTFRDFTASAFGDYAGIKKDDLTAGGTISPGFIFYDPIENQYYGYKAKFKSLSEFENTIVPDVVNSNVTQRLIDEGDFLDEGNAGWQIIQNINNGNESGKSQAKFKRIAMEHYLHCIRVLIDHGNFNA